MSTSAWCWPDDVSGRQNTSARRQQPILVRSRNAHRAFCGPMMACRPNANQTGLRRISEPTKMPTAVRCQFTDQMPVTSDIGLTAGRLAFWQRADVGLQMSADHKPIKIDIGPTAGRPAFRHWADVMLPTYCRTNADKNQHRHDSRPTDILTAGRGQVFNVSPMSGSHQMPTTPNIGPTTDQQHLLIWT